MSRHFQTAQQYVLTTLRTEILNGQYPENTHLRQEEVARRLNVSTTPVREAFRDLRAEGLVSIDPNKGVVTRSLTIADVTEIYELRITLEPMLAERACRQMTAADLAAATHCHDSMSATDSPEKWSLVNEAFHDHFVASQASTRLFEMVASLSRVARPYVALSMHVDQDIMASNNREHAALLAAYRAGDAAAVQAQTRTHLENTRDALVACVDHWAAPRASAG
ncbi:MAG: GntR family transcriptional regulator [Janthinobacterium lividum]